MKPTPCAVFLKVSQRPQDNLIYKAAAFVIMHTKTFIHSSSLGDEKGVCFVVVPRPQIGTISHSLLCLYYCDVLYTILGPFRRKVLLQSMAAAVSIH
jgi:hypothetical protein